MPFEDDGIVEEAPMRPDAVMLDWNIRFPVAVTVDGLRLASSEIVSVKPSFEQSRSVEQF